MINLIGSVNSLTDPFDGIRAVCPKCGKETPGTFGHLTGSGRRFNCSCGQSYIVADADISGALIGTKFYGQAPNFQKRNPIPPQQGAAPKPADERKNQMSTDKEHAEFLESFKQELALIDEANARKKAANSASAPTKQEETLNPVVAEAMRRANQ